MVLQFIILSIVLFLLSPVESKLVHCKNRFPGGNYPRLWIYCTKFGVGAPNQMKFTAKAKLIAPYSKHSGVMY